MSEGGKPATERIRVREVAGVFRSRESLEDAPLRAGFDRAI